MGGRQLPVPKAVAAYLGPAARLGRELAEEGPWFEPAAFPRAAARHRGRTAAVLSS